jgi:hypothetical protein
MASFLQKYISEFRTELIHGNYFSNNVHHLKEPVIISMIIFKRLFLYNLFGENSIEFEYLFLTSLVTILFILIHFFSTDIVISNGECRKKRAIKI